jgi:hypothetical protein
MEKKPKSKNPKPNELNELVEGLIVTTKNALALINGLQQNELRLLKDQQWLTDTMVTMEKDTALLKSEVHELRNVLDSVLQKLHLEVKKIVKDKENEKGTYIHDDCTERCRKCNSIVSRKEKTCAYCGHIKK